MYSNIDNKYDNNFQSINSMVLDFITVNLYSYLFLYYIELFINCL